MSEGGGGARGPAGLGAPPSTLDEFRNNTKNRPWDIRDISGDIVEFCQVHTHGHTHIYIHTHVMVVVVVVFF
jgi:hypothetical protein